MKKILMSLLSVIAITGCSSIQGVVRDKPTGTPIPSAIVNVGNTSATTDAIGHYHLVGSFMPGNTLMVNAPGYNIYTHTIKSQNDIADIELSPKNHN